MASRKSSRVKKSPVVYQAPEPVHRAPRNVTPKQIPPRRSFSRDIELQMECVDDELSPAQLKAIKEAQKEHEKANDLIKEVRAGNILVPSSQPNTFTIVPPKPPQTQQKPAAVQVQAPALKSPSPPLELLPQRGLPPPRPAQFLSKHAQEINKSQAGRSSTDVILISDTPAVPGVTKIPVSQVTANPMQIQQMATLMPSQGPSATPQQVYKFVSVPSNMPTNVVQNQWALRPLLTVPPQQQQQQQKMTFLTTAARCVAQFTPVRTLPVQQGQIQMPAPRSTSVSGKELDKVRDKTANEELNGGGRAMLTARMGVRHSGTVIQNHYFTRYGISRSQKKVGCCHLGFAYQHGIKMGIKTSEKTHCVSSLVYSWKVRLHCVRISVLFDTDTARQAYNKYGVKFSVWTSLYKHWLKSVRLKSRAPNCLRSDAEVGNSVLKLNGGGTDKKKNHNCDKDKCAYKDVVLLNGKRNCNQESKHLYEKKNAHVVCDNLDGENLYNGSEPGTEMSHVLNERTGLFRESYALFNFKKQELSEVAKCPRSCESDSNLLEAQKREKLETVMCYLKESVLLREKLWNESLSERLYFGSQNLTFQSAFDSYLRQSLDSTENDIDEKYERASGDQEVKDHNEVVKKSEEPSDSANVNSAYQHIFKDYLQAYHSSQQSRSDISTTRKAMKELDHINRSGHQLDRLKKIEMKSVSCFKRNKINTCLLNQQSTKGCRNRARMAYWDKENITSCVIPKSVVQSKDFSKSSLWNYKQISKGSLYETVTKKKVHRSFGIVNMIYESTKFKNSDNISSDLNGANVGLDESSSVVENQLCEPAGGIAKETDINEFNDNSDNTDLSEKHQTTVIQPNLPVSLNIPVEKVVIEESKHLDDTVEGNHTVAEQSPPIILEDKMKEKEMLVKTKKFQEVNGNNLICGDLNENFKSKLTGRKVESEQKVSEAGKSLITDRSAEVVGQSDQNKDNFETDDLWSECSGDVSSSDDENCLKEQETWSCTRTVGKWYHKMSQIDAVCVAVLCSQFGFTKMSRDLQIPKTVLLKLRRHVRKLKSYPNIAFSSATYSSSVGQKSSEVFDPLNTGKETKVTTEWVNNFGKDEVSILQRYHPGLYMTAQRLLVERKVRHATEKEWDVESVFVDDDAENIASEELELCQRTQFVSEPQNFDTDKSQSSETVDKVAICSQTYDVNRQYVRLDRNTESKRMISMNDCTKNACNEMDSFASFQVVESYTKAEGKKSAESETENQVPNDQDNFISVRKKHYKIPPEEIDKVQDSPGVSLENEFVSVVQGMLPNEKRYDLNRENNNKAILWSMGNKSFKDICLSKNSAKDSSETDLENDLGDAVISFDNGDCVTEHRDTADNHKLEVLQHREELNSLATLNETCFENLKETGSTNVKVNEKQTLPSSDNMRKDQKKENHDKVIHHNYSRRLQERDECQTWFNSNHDHCYLNKVWLDTDKEIQGGHRTNAENLLEDENETAFRQQFSSSFTNPEEMWEEVEGRKIKVYCPLSEKRLKDIVQHANTFGLKSAAGHYSIPEDHAEVLVYHSLSCLRKQANGCHTLTQGIPANYISSILRNENSGSLCYQEVPNANPIEDSAQVSAESATYENSVIQENLEIMIVKQDKEETLSEKQKNKVSLQQANCKKKDTKENTGCVHRIVSIEHPVYTKEFLKYAVENKLFMGDHKVIYSMKKTMTEISEILGSVDVDKSVKTFTNKNGHVLHRYSPEFQRRMLVLASKFGLRAVAERFNIVFETLCAWKIKLKKSMEIYRKLVIERNDEQDHNGAKKDTFEQEMSKLKMGKKGKKHSQVRKRASLSTNIKIKLAHMCRMFGVAKVRRQYNFCKSTLQKWKKEYDNVKLTDYEFTNAEVVELVDREKYKEDIELKFSESNSGKLTGAVKRSSGSKSDRSLHVTYPNNMEVLLGIDDESDGSNEMQNFECNSYDSLNEIPVLSNNTDFGTDDKCFKLLNREKSDDSVETVNPTSPAVSDERSTKEQFLGQNSYFMEAVNNELTLDESETEDVVEIVSWDIKHQTLCCENVLKKKPVIEEAPNSGVSLIRDEEVSILQQDIERSVENINVRNVNSSYDSEKGQKVSCDRDMCKPDGDKGYLKADEAYNSNEVGKYEIGVQLQHTLSDISKGEKVNTLKKNELEPSSTAMRKAQSDVNTSSKYCEKEIEKQTYFPEKKCKKLVLVSDDTDKAISADQAIVTSSERIWCSEKVPDENHILVENSLLENEHDINIGHYSVDKMPSNNLFVDVIYISDGEDHCSSELQLLSPSDIKEEPYDDEFDKIEKGRSFKKLKDEQTYTDGDCKRQNSGQGKNKHSLTGLETNNLIFADNSEKAGSKSYEINQLGIGDGNGSQTQGNSFQSSSGNSHSRSQGTASANITGTSGSSDINVSNLPVSGPNIQIVGTGDLIPGQEYILVDPRLFSSGSNDYQTIRPPALIRPQIRHPVTNTDIVIHRSLVNRAHIGSSGMPTPVHVVENRSVRMSRPSAQMSLLTPPAPRLTLYGNVGTSREAQDRRMVLESSTVRSLLTGTRESTVGSRLHEKVIVKTNPKINLPDRRNTSPGRSTVDVSQSPSTAMPQTSGRNVSSVGRIVNVSQNISTDTQQTSRMNVSSTSCLQIVAEDVNKGTSAVLSDSSVTTSGDIPTTTGSANYGKDKKICYTLKGVGSITSENLAVPSTSEDDNPVMLTEGNDKMCEKSLIESDNRSKQFPKSMQDSSLLLEKEHKLLQALLSQKTEQNSSHASSDYSIKLPEETSAEMPQQIPNSNRINSLIQKMTHRFQKCTDEFKIQSSLSVINLRKSKVSEMENDGKPSSASQILFGEHSSPKKKEFNLKSHSGESSTKLSTFSVFEAETSTESKDSSTSIKKDLRKSALVMREIDSTEDESSSSSSTSECSASSSTSSSDQINETKDGRIEHVDLSAKLKSLLSADIFNVVEPQKQNVEDDDDLIEILSNPSDKKHVPSNSLKHRENDSSRKSTNSKNINDETAVDQKKKDLPMKKGGINYSVNIKKKLGKLASMFSIVSLSKKYGINANTLARWKAKYQDEEIAGLQLTETELKELEEVSNIKKALYGTSEPEYDIYVDNPEEDENEMTESSGSKQKDEKMVSKSTSEMTGSKIQESESTKSRYSDEVITKPESNQPAINMAKESSKSTLKFGTPLYICIENDTSEEIKQQLRRKIKTQKTAEEAWSNGAFLKTSKSSLASVFGQDDSKSDEDVMKAEKSLKSLVSSETDSASEKESVSARENMVSDNVKRDKLRDKAVEMTCTDSDQMTWEKTVYLCPDEGIFKYKYEIKKAGNSNTNVSESNENQTVSVLDSLFKNPATAPVSTVNTQVSEPLPTYDKSEKPQNTSSSPLDIAKMLKETPKRTSLMQSTNINEDTAAGPLKTTEEKLVNMDKVDLSTRPFSEDFKWNVVKEARLSGFESTAKMYNISMTDIMKWHDSFLDEKKSKDLDSMKTQLCSATETSSNAVDLTADEQPFMIESDLTGIPGKRIGRLNANLSFERINVKEGTITKPRFSSKPPIITQTLSSAFSVSSRPQRTRMGPNSIKYATPKVDPEQLEKFHADVQGDLGIMPKILKKSKNKQEGLEIASTWKQVQSVLNPSKASEKRYSLEFKNKIIKECEQKGQKSVALEHKIPYNELSRWRIEAKKASSIEPFPKHTSSSDVTKGASSVVNPPHKTHIKKVLSDSNKEQLVGNDSKPQSEQESLKIKIKLSSLSPVTSSSLNNKKKDLVSKPVSESSLSRNVTETSSVSTQKLLATENPLKNSNLTPKGKQDGRKNDYRHAVGTDRTKSVERLEPVSIDEDVDLRMEVINFCLEQGVLKTQKKFNVTRQSIIDLMKEYDELNKYEVDNYNKSREHHSFKTRLVSREKTSVEVTNTATQPVIVKNLNDYIVTQEYMKTVVDYALKHGITAATRKYKRKTSTVRSWMNQFQREVKKKISVEQMAKEQELLAKNMSIEEARKISNLEARKKKQLLEAEFKRHIVEFAREFGITAASRRFKKKAATVKMWMGHFMKCERDAKRQEEAVARKNQVTDQESAKSPRASSPKRLSIYQDSVAHKSPSSSKQKTPPQSPIWEQDFVIKPTSSNSPLKLTFSPRRKSSPVIVIGSSTEEDTFDDETNDVETDDEQENISGEYFEVAAWDINSSGSRVESGASNFRNNDGFVTNLQCSVEKTNVTVVDLLSDDDNMNNENVSHERKKNLQGKNFPANNSVVDNQQNSAENGDKVSSIGKQTKRVETLINPQPDTPQLDVLISPMEVPNIFDTSDMSYFDEMTAEMMEGNFEVKQLAKKDIEEVKLVNESENETAVTEALDEDESVKLPYEETMMFKLLTDEVHNFIKDDTAVVTYRGNDTASSKHEEKPVLPNDERDSKLGPVKKFKKYADAEIMQNIEETYLFTGSRVTRHAASKEHSENIYVTATDQEEKKNGSGDREEHEILFEKRNIDNSEGAKNNNENENRIKNKDSVKNNTSNILNINYDSVEQRDFKKSDTDTTLQGNSPDIQKKVERSLFDMLVSGGEKSENSETNMNVDMPVSKDIDEQEDNMSPGFSLFGSLIKGIKIPQAGVKSQPVIENITAAENVSTSLNKDKASPEKSDLNKDRSERNLFDFIGLEPESPKPPTNVPPSQTLSPRIQTRSASRAGVSPTKSPHSPSPAKMLTVKKPMFKFPKLASPINFGNIAKLGIAKLREGEKVKETKECNDEEGNVVSEDNQVEVKAKDENNGKEYVKKAVNENDGGDKNEVVMETFEELRQRLARERAAIKLEKEKAKAVVVDTKSMDIDEIDGSREACSDIQTSQFSEIGDEMYKDFTPQKIVLILDISKKHGIEFASTSFGLPVSVIVNWIIEKDRKHRKVALSVSLEEKLKALKNLKDGLISKENTKECHSIDNIVLDKWESEAGWLLENKSVCDVLEKWQKVETVTNLNFKECVKNLERKDSVSEKEIKEGNFNRKEETEKLSEKETENKISEDSEVVITRVEKHSDEKDIEYLVLESISKEEPSAEERQIDLPNILSFVKTTRPRDFNTEQKAMLVLLVQKYGSLVISKKFGINSGTLYSWRHSSRSVRQCLYEQTGSVIYKDKCKTVSSVDYLQARETRSQADSYSKTLKVPEAAVTSKTSQPYAIKFTEKKTIEDGLIDPPKGYRIISPTKLPPILQDIKRCQTRDYTLEQKVAIIKLVQLYGVRTIHKQFHIPAGTIWNWQHAKNIVEVLKREEKMDDKRAQKVIDFDEEEDEDEPITIDTILDRVLTASDSVNHLNFKLDQKADVVCLINHFGIDYFCEKVPQIPRGTLWNWRHNRHVTALVEKRSKQIQRFTEILNNRKGNNLRENVVGEAVDKTDLTQKWLKDLQDSAGDGKELFGFRDSLGEIKKRKRNFNEETSWSSSKSKKPKLGPMCYKRTLPSERNHRSVSPSSISSEISVHSNDFEEIFSDDELNTPSVVSRKSGTSSQTVHSNKTGSAQRTGKGSSAGRTEGGMSSKFGGLGNDTTDESFVPVYEVIKCEIGADDRMMVCYKVLESKDASASQLVKATEFTGKRPAQAEPASAQPPAKKRNPKVTEVSDQSGNWVPLDEYYYGTHEGDTSYTEEKGEYRFKCWYCSKMLYNNVRAMQHIQGHIDASKQQNIDLSDLTQCKHCYKQFDTPFEMQTHVEKVHLSNKVLMCRICEKDFGTPKELMAHMKGNHHACEMPYWCHLCHFRSSMYSDVVDHFKKKHDSSHFMLCLYCLRTFEVKFVSQGWGQTQTYYGHLLKHQSKSATKKCVVCRLTFFNAGDVKNHRRTCHVTSLQDMRALSQGGRSDSGQKQRKGSNLKSLNAPSVSRIQDYGDVTFPPQTTISRCIECKMMMSSTDHYKKYVHCSMCRFATSCSVAYANHMMGFHSGQMSSLNLNIPWERPMKDIMYCHCGFSSKYGNKVANHLVYCAKWTCSSTKQAQSGSIPEKSSEEKKEGSLLGMLGLVQKSTVATNETTEEIRSAGKPQTETKSENKVLDKVKEVKKDTNEININTKLGDADVQKIKETNAVKILEEDKQFDSDGKSTQNIMETEGSEVTFKQLGEDVKKTGSEYTSLKEIDTDKDTSKDTDQNQKTVNVTEKIRENLGIEMSKNLEKTSQVGGTKEKSEKEQEILETEKDTGTNENLKKIVPDRIEKEFMDKELEGETGKTPQYTKVFFDASTESSEGKTRIANDRQELSKDEKEVMDTDTVDEPTVVSEDSDSEMIAQTEQPQDNTEPVDEIDKSVIEDTAKNDEENMNTEIMLENREEENDLRDEETVELLKGNELDTEAVESHRENQETEVEKKVSVQLRPLAASSQDDGDENDVENDERTNESKLTIGEEETVEMKERVETSEVQDTAELPEKVDEKADKQVDEPTESEAEKVKDKERKVIESPPSEGLGDKTQNRSESKPSGDRRDSSERHVKERHESGERYLSGSGDRSKHDDRPHDDDRYRHDNRSHGSHRSDSYHGNRSTNDQSQGRDRFYERDRERDRDRDRGRDRNRDRDFNRNRDYRQGDNRSGYSYHDNRNQGYSGSQGYRGSQGQYSGYQGNRGDNYQERNRGGHHQDRNYNRNYQNRGGYNQNYRGGYRGGYY